MLNVHCERVEHLQSMTGELDCTPTVLYIKEGEKKKGGKLENLGGKEVKMLDKRQKRWTVSTKAKNDEVDEDFHSVNFHHPSIEHKDSEEPQEK